MTKIRKDNLSHYFKKDSYQLIEEMEKYHNTFLEKDILEDSQWRSREIKENWIKQDIESCKILVYEYFTWNKVDGKRKAIQTKYLKLSPHYYNEIIKNKINEVDKINV